MTEEYVIQGRVTKEGMDKLREELPCANFNNVEEFPKAEELGNLFTVSYLIRFIETELSR